MATWVDIGANNQFLQVAEALPLVICLMTEDLSRVLFVNASYERVWGRSRQSLYDHPRSWLDAIDPNDHLSCELNDRDDPGWPSRPFRIIRPDGAVRTLVTRAFFIRGENGGHGLICRIDEDVSDRRHAQRVLSELAAIVESTDDAIIGATLDGTITNWNSGACRMYGYSATEAVGQSLATLCGRNRVAARRWREELLAAAGGVRHVQTVHRTRDGQAIDVSAAVSPISGADGRPIGLSVIARDVTAWRQLEREAVRISTMERQRIGHDLHDMLGQTLTAASLLAKSLALALKREGSPRSAAAAETADMLKEAMAQMRAIARGLSPLHPTAGGPRAALQDLADNVPRLYGLTCLFKCRLKGYIRDADVVTQMAYIAREAVSNAARHARANRIEIVLDGEDQFVTMTVRDDGVGIGLCPQDKPGQGMGLRLMQYRASLIGGSLAVQPGPRGGTEVIFGCELVPGKHRDGQDRKDCENRRRPAGQGLPRGRPSGGARGADRAD